MTLYAHVIEGRVHEIIDLPEPHTIEDAFHPDLLWIPCGPEVKEGWELTKDGELSPWTPSAEEIDECRSQLVEIRKILLANSAWSQAPDEPEDVRKKWGFYRKVVRDLDLDKDDPFSVKWPQLPAA